MVCRSARMQVRLPVIADLLKDLAGGQIELVSNEPLAAPHGCQQGALAEFQLACSSHHVATHVLLQAADHKL